MWLSKMTARRREPEVGSAAATVSVGGEAPAVVTDAERRQGRLFSPGGYCWRPAGGETVLVVGGGEPCVAGTEQHCPVELAPGEVYIHSGKAWLWLKNDGSVVLSGKLVVQGGAEISGGLTVDGAPVGGVQEG